MEREELRRMYWDQGLSTYKIGEILHRDPKTIWWRLNKFGIFTRPRKVVKIKKSVLKELYSKQGHTLKVVGERYGISPAAVLRKMRNFHIPLRSCWEHNLLSPRLPFSGPLWEKAYLIGFRIGDLNVVSGRNKYVVEVGSNTTKIEQISLMKDTYGKYAHVSVSRKNKIGVMTIGVSLDRSFKFLLPKIDEVEPWIRNSNKNMVAFVAGYVDAEGNMGIYGNRARFRIGSCDIGILKRINNWLHKLGIKSILFLDTAKGVRPNGVPLNKDFWRIVVNDRYSILKTIDLLWPYLKHEKRRRDFDRAKANVMSRIDLKMLKFDYAK